MRVWPESPRPPPGCQEASLTTRHLDWNGCLNARDLGGLPAAGGRITRWGAVVRSDDPARLSPAGWSAVRAHGVRTIVDLRNDGERSGPVAEGAAGLATMHVPMDDLAYSGFWRRIWDGGLDGTPLYYRPFLSRSRSGAPRWRRWPTPGRAGSWSLARRNSTTRDVVLAILEAVDVEASLRGGGLGDHRLRAVRDRLLAPPGRGGRP